MKAKSLSVTLVLTLSIASTALAEINEETSKHFYDGSGTAYLVSGDYVRVRTHPSTYGYIICELRKGECVKTFNPDEKPHEDETGMK